MPVNKYLKSRFKVDFVDTITEAGPIKILSNPDRGELFDSIIRRLEISIRVRDLTGAAIVSHFDCIGNPVDKETQMNQLQKSVQLLKERYPQLEIIGLWVNDNWEVQEVSN